MVANGGADAVTDALGAHAAVPEVVLQAALAMRALQTDEDVRQSMAVECGGLALLAGALKAHAGRADVAGAAAAAASGLLGSPLRKVAAVQAGLFDRAIECLEANNGIEGCQRSGFEILKALAVLDDVRMLTVSCDRAIRLIVVGIESHLESAPVCEEGCGALCNLMSDSVPNQNAAINAGAIETVVAGMARFVGTPGVQESGCAALWALAGTGTNKFWVADLGGIKAVVAAMAVHPRTIAIQARLHIQIQNPASTCFADLVPAPLIPLPHTPRPYPRWWAAPRCATSRSCPRTSWRWPPPAAWRRCWTRCGCTATWRRCRRWASRRWRQ